MRWQQKRLHQDYSRFIHLALVRISDFRKIHSRFFIFQVSDYYNFPPNLSIFRKSLNFQKYRKLEEDHFWRSLILEVWGKNKKLISLNPSTRRIILIKNLESRLELKKDVVDCQMKLLWFPFISKSNQLAVSLMCPGLRELSLHKKVKNRKKHTKQRKANPHN